MADLVALKSRIGRGWLGQGHGVHAVGVGPKQVCGVLTDSLALRVYVAHKRPRRALGLSDRLPAYLDGLNVDVVESPPAWAHSGGPREPRDPICAGVSIGRSGVTFGTLGALCRSTLPEDAGKVLLLSNHHVLVGPAGSVGDSILQPGPGDARHAPARPVARLLRARAIQTGHIANRIDAAVAVVEGVSHDLSLPGDVGRILSTGTAQINTIVCKFGRTTGGTEGIVTDLHCTAVVGLDRTNRDLKTTFIDQIRIDRRRPGDVFADAGDSGAVILEQGLGRVVGLYFAGPIDGSYGLANHVADVTSRLQIELKTEGAE